MVITWPASEYDYTILTAAPEFLLIRNIALRTAKHWQPQAIYFHARQHVINAHRGPYAFHKKLYSDYPLLQILCKRNKWNISGVD